jgi:hypothetical protein
VWQWGRLLSCLIELDLTFLFLCVSIGRRARQCFPFAVGLDATVLVARNLSMCRMSGGRSAWGAVQFRQSPNRLLTCLA